MNISNKPFSPWHCFSVQVLPSTPGKEKSMATAPKSHIGVSKLTIR
jgi:hypothetical protein